MLKLCNNNSNKTMLYTVERLQDISSTYQSEYNKVKVIFILNFKKKSN